MKTLQLLQGACVVALGVTVGCNRSGTTDAQQVRDEARQAAAKAGEQLADGWLMTKVQAQFFADADVHARNIAVTARDGVVTLKGRVPDENAHTQATQIARNTDGVRNIVDQLVVGPADAQAASRAPTPPAPPAPPSEVVATSGNALPDVAARGLTLFEDARITSAIQSKYFLDGTVKGRQINVDTSTGVVRLTGEVGSEVERAQALQLARETEGVQRVEDGLTVNPQATSDPPVAPSVNADEAITTKIQAQFFLDPDVKVDPMKVTTSNGIVTLEGEVRSQAAKDRAIEVARQTDGVMQVIDRLQVQRATGGRPAPARRK